MRAEIETIFKETFRDLTIAIRDDLGFTQARMSEALLMSERSYSDIESGRSSCGAITALMLILHMDNRDELLDKLKARILEMYLSEV